jgi:DNA-binding HxlR family transcriptional regulator
LLIVRDALRGKRRFGEFQKSLGLAKNILGDRLRKLVAEGVMEVQPSP